MKVSERQPTQDAELLYKKATDSISTGSRRAISYRLANKSSSVTFKNISALSAKNVIQS